jgi:hypothetical protein
MMIGKICGKEGSDLRIAPETLEVEGHHYAITRSGNFAEMVNRNNKNKNPRRINPYLPKMLMLPKWVNSKTKSIFSSNNNWLQNGK